VVEALPFTVMAGEHDYNKWQMRDLITRGQVDVVNLDTIKCGGLTECQKVASMAHAFDKTVMMHNTRPTLGTAASLHLIASMPNAARVQEYAGPRPELGLEGLFAQELKFEDGYLWVPQGPGLGMEADEKEMKRRMRN
jgi:L-alanine-DL-glutamate epimerase-like enolase superfamily enzyme